jgi:signal transduction histidine kinase
MFKFEKDQRAVAITRRSFLLTSATAAAGLILVSSEAREEKLLHIKGRELYYELLFAPFRNEMGEVEGVTTVALDITNRKRGQLLLQQANAALEKRAKQLRNLTIELTNTEERERRQLAGILHDNLQQYLVAAKISLETLSGYKSKPENIFSELNGIQNLLDEAIAVSRSLTAELAPAALYDKGMPEALRWLARWMEEKYGLAVEVNTDDRCNDLDQDLRALLFQAIRELLFNVAKHAQVKRATVNLCYGSAGNMFSAEIRDEGIGFDPREKEEGEGSTTDGFGLFTIRERLAAIGGQLKIESAPGHGTTSSLYIPVHSN